MGRGKPNMATNVEEENIIITDENSGAVPFYQIDNEWGITADEHSYALSNGKIAHRKETIDEKEVIISYKRWSKVSYHDSIWAVLKAYAKRKERMDLSQLKNADIGEIAQISESIKNVITQKMNEYAYDFNIEEIGELEQTKKRLTREIEELVAMKESLQNEYDETVALLKKIRNEKLMVK